MPICVGKEWRKTTSFNRKYIERRKRHSHFLNWNINSWMSSHCNWCNLFLHFSFVYRSLFSTNYFLINQIRKKNRSVRAKQWINNTQREQQINLYNNIKNSNHLDKWEHQHKKQIDRHIWNACNALTRACELYHRHKWSKNVREPMWQQETSKRQTERERVRASAQITERKM